MLVETLVYMNLSSSLDLNSGKTCVYEQCWSQVSFCLSDQPPRQTARSLASVLLSRLSGSASRFLSVWTFNWGCPDLPAQTYLWKELVRRCELNPWLISEHDTVREPGCSPNRSSEDGVWFREKDLSWGGIRNKRERERNRDINWVCSLFLLCALVFCCCFTGVQSCAMNWGLANSLQFVKSSHNCCLGRGWGWGGQSHWCQPSNSRVITGHWAVQSRGGVSKHGAAPLHLQLYKVILKCYRLRWYKL